MIERVNVITVCHRRGSGSTHSKAVCQESRKERKLYKKDSHA